ncbi:MAG: hypothetical protein JST41_00435 [Bacteroidetes bacterium]|nr:hypothetical protein [Bacteroidota bacterium]MBX7129519.1 hypothetical protein [Flavobacteriales bacterium]MCC6653837.1 hypothetical protein [Flavobacteriales bacterium]HMU13708.1 hypothetical protein [Flavobacteriales bacterium]HMW97650.1 hypothetical protein [Flavobacteriales bacterium]
MRPLNTRERRVQFFRFLALFLLAIAPFILLTWLFGRVDHVENEFLRSQYETKRADGAVAAKYREQLIKLERSTGGLKDYVVTKSGTMAKLDFNDNGTLTDHIGKVKSDLENFENESRESDSTLISITKALESVATNLQNAYIEAAEEVAKKNEELSEMKKDLDKAKTERDEFETRYNQVK